MIASGGQSSDMQQSLRVAALNGSWWRCVALTLIGPRVWGAVISKNSRSEFGERLNMTFADEVCEIADQF